MAAIPSQSEVAVKPARPYGAIAVWSAVWFAVVWSMAANLCAQETAPMHTGVPQDWSQQHIVFSRDGLARHPDLIYREPRVLQQAMQRWQAPNFGAFDSSGPVPTAADNSGAKGDWSVPSGGRMLINQYPAKFSFNPGAPPDCTNDYAVFGLTSHPPVRWAILSPSIISMLTRLATDFVKTPSRVWGSRLRRCCLTMTSPPSPGARSQLPRFCQRMERRSPSLKALVQAPAPLQ